MPTIYKYNNDFDENVVISNMNDISEELEEEQSKPIERQDREKMLKLVNKQFYEGLKLSTGYCNLWKY